MPRTPHEIAEDLFRLYVTLPEIVVNKDDRQAYELAQSWYARTWHTTKATLLLHEQGFVTEAAPLRRSLIEHALALQWIGHSPGPAYDATVKAHQYLVGKFAEKPESATAVPREVIDELLNLELVGGPEQVLLQMYELCKKYGPPGAYTGWFFETGGSHASWRSGQPYRKPRVTSDPVQDAMVVLWFALATAGFSMLLRDDPWVTAVEAVDRELGAEGGTLYELLQSNRRDDG
jgi:hypothetical protein